MNNLAIKVSADIADAQAKLSVLNAEFRGTQSQLNALARTGAAGNLDAAGQAELQAASARLLELRAAAQPVAKAMTDAGFSVKGFSVASLQAGAAANEAGVNVSSLTRYGRELFDEFSSGRTRYIPSTLAELANQGFHLKPAMLAGYGGVAVLTAGLVYLAYRGMKAQEAIRQISASAAFLGNVNVSQDFAGQLVSQIKTSADVGEEEAQKTARAITSIQNLSRASMSAIAGNIGVVATALATTTDKAAGTVAKILDVNTSVQKLQDLLPGLTADQVQQAKASQEGGDYAQILTERWRLLTSQLERMQEAQRAAIQQKLAFAQTGTGQQDVAGKAELDNSYIYIHQLQEQQRQIEKNIALTKQMAANPLGPGAEQNQLKSALDAAEKLDAKDTERRQLVGQIASMEHAILSANQAQRAELEAGISAASQKLADLNKGPATGTDENARLQALQQLGEAHQREAQKEISDSQRVLSQLLEVQGVEADSAQQVLQIRVQTADQALNAAVESGRMSAAQRLAIEQRLTQALYAQDVKRLQDQLATIGPQTPEYARVVGQIEALQAQHYQRLATLDQQYEQAKRQQEQKSLADRKKLTKEVEGYENQMLSGLLSGRMTFANMERSIFQQLAGAEIEAVAHSLTEQLMLHEAASARRLALKVVTATKAIAIDAAEAAAGAFKAMVGIPYVGPILGAAAAAAALIEVKNFAHFDVGAYDIPGDMAAVVHRGEMILPRPFAEEARQKGFLGGAGVGGGDTYHVHIHANDAASFEDMASRNSAGLVRVFRKLVRSGALKQ